MIPQTRGHLTTRLFLVALIIAACALPGCSRVTLAYGAADFLITRYADDYLGLEGTQIDRWEPRLEAAIATHRHGELPHLAGYADALRRTAEANFPAAQTRCLVDGFLDLYRRHARIAVSLASPLLADLSPAQVQALGARFAEEAANDKPKDQRNPAWEERKRAKHWIEGIEDWTGPLSDPQKRLVAHITARMPDTAEPVYAYRTTKREELMKLIRSGASEARINRFLTEWLVDYKDLPKSLKRAQETLSERIVELFSQLGPTLTPKQHTELNERLVQLRDDLMDLQRRPHMDPLGC